MKTLLGLTLALALPASTALAMSLPITGTYCLHDSEISRDGYSTEEVFCAADERQSAAPVFALVCVGEGFDSTPWKVSVSENIGAGSLVLTDEKTNETFTLRACS